MPHTARCGADRIRGVSTADPAFKPNPAATPEDVTARFSLRQRSLIWMIAQAAGAVMWLLGRTLRYSISIEAGGPESARLRPAVFAFWHRCILPATYVFRDYGVRVMTSRSFDGECMARVIERFGFLAVRGSSSRGAVAALLGLRRELEAGMPVAFTIDGPRGPRYIAKPGPVGLARATQTPLVAFYAAAEKSWVLNSWDEFVIPKPFSRVLVRLGRIISVPAGADDEAVEAAHRELQASLERVQAFAEQNVAQVGSPGFPQVKSV